MSNFNFHLQRFNDDGGTTDVTSDSTGAEESYQLTFDENGDPRLAIIDGPVDSGATSESVDEQTAETTENEPAAETAETTPSYTVTVDGEQVEVPLPEVLNGYMRQAKFTKEMQNLARQREEFNAQVQAAQAEFMRTQQNGQTQEKKGLDFDEVVESAKRGARAILGLSPEEELSELDFKHTAAFNTALQGEMASRNSEFQRQHNINVLERELRMNEPLFDQVYAFAQESLETMPVKDFKALQGAWATGDTTPIKNFFEKARVEFYASKAKMSTSPKQVVKPPVVEKPGTGFVQAPVVKKANPESLRSMNSDDKAKWLVDNGFV